MKESLIDLAQMDIDVPPSDSHETLRTAFVSRNLEPREAARAAAAAAARGWRVAPAGDDSHASTSSATAPAAELQWVLPKEVDWDRVGPRRLCNRLRIRPGLIHKDKLAQVLRASLPARHGALAGGEGALVPETHVLEDSDELRVICKARGGQWVLKVSNSSNANLSAAIMSEGDVESAAALVDGHTDLRWVLQRYVSPPLLVDGRKFHIRAFVLLAGFPLRAYLHRDAFALSSSVPFDADSKDKRVHFTNRSVQVLCSSAGTSGADAYDQSKHLVPLEEAVGAERAEAWHGEMREACRTVLARLEAHPRWLLPQEGAFEIFGVDFLPDASGRLWLLEFNACPSLWLSSSVIEDALAVVVSGKDNSDAGQGHRRAAESFVASAGATREAGRGAVGTGGFVPFYAYSGRAARSAGAGSKTQGRGADAMHATGARDGAEADCCGATGVRPSAGARGGSEL